MAKIKVDSIAKFFKVIENNKIISDKNRNIYFRGLGDKSWKDIPSLYRDNGHIENEYNIYHKMISTAPDEFIDCHSVFDHLVKMQHYGLPTRLLDITKNPLVALYFACCSEEKSDGKINIYSIPSDTIKTYDSDTVSIIANLAKMKKFSLVKLDLLQHISIMANYSFYAYNYRFLNNDNDNTNSVIKTYKNILPIKCDDSHSDNVVEFLIKYTEEQIECLKEYHKKYALKTNNDEESLRKSKYFYYDITNLEKSLEYLKTPTDNIFINWKVKIREAIQLLNNSFIGNKSFLDDMINEFISEIKEYIYKIKSEKPLFDSTLLRIQDISSVQCVEPKKNNLRISKQDGAFFIFGLSECAMSKNEVASIPNQFYIQDKNNTPIEIIVPLDKKGNILKQLASLSISKSTLFPEANNIADDIKKSYLE